MDEQQIAEAAAQAAADKAAKKGTPAFTFVAPKESSCTGELLNVAPVEEKGIVLVYVQDEDDTVIVCSTSIAYWKKVGAFFAPGSILKVGYEKRIEGVTSYKDQAGVVKTHTSSGLSVLNVAPYSVSAWNQAKANRKQASDMVQIVNQAPETVNAVSSYLAATFTTSLKG
jgi:hypothetical protein